MGLVEPALDLLVDSFLARLSEPLTLRDLRRSLFSKLEDLLLLLKYQSNQFTIYTTLSFLFTLSLQHYF